MKINKTKITITTLALAMGAALAGSISGSVAWYQYSTRAAAQIAGTSAGTEGRLQIKKSTDAESAYTNYVSITGAEFKPLSVTKANDGTLAFFDHPVYQYANLPAAELSSGVAVGAQKYTFNFRFQENKVDTPSWQDVLTKKVYLSHFAITKVGDDVDVTDAVRVAFLDASGKAKFILGKSAAAVTTDTKQQLDIGGATGVVDTTYWDCQDDSTKVDGTNVKYVEYTTGAENYATNAQADVLADVSNPYAIESANTGKDLSSTAADNELSVLVWLEGFAEIGGSSLWDHTTIGQNFNIEMQFQVEANR